MSESSTPHRSASSLRNLLIWGPLLTIVLFWQLLYMPRLRDTPGWYGDETAAVVMGQNLFKGLPTNGPFFQTYWHQFNPYQPGFLWLTGLFSAVTGGDILGARFFTALIALAIGLAICFLGRSRMGILPAWFGSLLFLSYPQSVIHFRAVFAHDGVALGFALACLFLLRPSRPRNDWRVGLSLAIATLCHPLFTHAAIAAWLCRLKKPGAWWRLALPPAIALGLIFLFVTITYWPHAWLIDDIRSLSRHYQSDTEQNNVITNISVFYTQDFFHIGAVIGILLCCRRRLYPIAICAAVASYLLLHNRQNLSVFYYQAIILVPILALAWAGGVSVLVSYFRKKSFALRGRRLAFGAVFLLPIVLLAIQLGPILRGKLPTRIDYWLTQSTPEVDLAASWLNNRTTPADLVIANVNIAWLLHARTADFFQIVLWGGKPTEFFPDGMPRERFRYPASLDRAKFVVVGDIDQRYVFGRPNVDAVVEQIQKEKWPVVWQEEFYTILANPALVQVSDQPPTHE